MVVEADKVALRRGEEAKNCADIVGFPLGAEDEALIGKPAEEGLEGFFWVHKIAT